MKSILLIIVLLLVAACEENDPGMRQFIESIIRNPNDIERIFKESPYYDEQSFKLTDSKIECYSKYFASYGGRSWTIRHADAYGADDSLPYRLYYVLGGVDDIGTEFQFRYEENKWKLIFLLLDDTYIFEVCPPPDSLILRRKALFEEIDSLRKLESDSILE